MATALLKSEKSHDKLAVTQMMSFRGGGRDDYPDP